MKRRKILEVRLAYELTELPRRFGWGRPERSSFVEVETAPGPTQGMTLVDWWATRGQEPNATVMNEIDDERFFALLLERIARL